jgi:hypothetical protein
MCYRVRRTPLLARRGRAITAGSCPLLSSNWRGTALSFFTKDLVKWLQCSEQCNQTIQGDSIHEDYFVRHCG